MRRSELLGLRQPQIYVATAVIQVEQQEQNVLKREETVRLEAPDYLTTIVATLTGDSFLVRVAKAAGLLNDPAFFLLGPNPIPMPKLPIACGAMVSAKVRRRANPSDRHIGDRYRSEAGAVDRRDGGQGIHAPNG